MQTFKRALRTEDEHDLSMPQFRVLACLHQNKGVDLSTLAAHFVLTLPTLSKMIDGLVRRGYVTRAPSEQDRRRIVLGLTAAGTQVFKNGRARVELRMAAMLATLSLQEKRNISEAMKALRAALQPATSCKR